MITDHKQYYFEMLKRGRLMPIIIDGVCLGFITFYITNDESMFANGYPWRVMDDNEGGNIFYIAQLLTDKRQENARIFFDNWNSFKKHIKQNFPTVNTVCWRRWNRKKNIVKVYKKEI